MISHKHKCIFIHIPKTAGTSIEKKLGLFEEIKRGVQDHTTIRNVEKHFDKRYQLRRLKNNIKRIEIRKAFKRTRILFFPELSRRQYNEYFKFSFVRNSWSRVYSWYSGVIRDEIHRKEFNISAETSLKDFLEKTTYDWGLQSQLNWIKDKKGNIPLDFIGRFEKIEEDFSHVCRNIGIPDASLPRLLSSNNKSYTDFFDKGTIDIVYQMFREEIVFFNFEFGE